MRYIPTRNLVDPKCNNMFWIECIQVLFKAHCRRGLICASLLIQEFKRQGVCLYCYFKFITLYMHNIHVVILVSVLERQFISFCQIYRICMFCRYCKRICGCGAFQIFCKIVRIIMQCCRNIIVHICLYAVISVQDCYSHILH